MTPKPRVKTAKPAKPAKPARPTFTGRSRPKVVLPGYNVFDAALDRIRWLYQEFDGRVTVSSSGGKDSTVVVELALIVARELGALPLKVFWLDQECEYASTVRYQRWMADRPEIDFTWWQVPFKLFNATNLADPWLNVWGPGEEWVRDKEPDAIVDNPFTRPDGSMVDRFGELLSRIHLDGGGARLAGIRADESPARRLSVNCDPGYKWVTWSVGVGTEPDGRLCRRFQPIHDWRYWDVWKAIHDNGWRYNDRYDALFQAGVPLRNMRVSNYHHEGALDSLSVLQVTEPETWEAATRRLQGIGTHGHLGRDQYPTSLPYMFKSWHEYMDHLIDNLAPPESRPTFRKLYARVQRSCPWEPDEVLCQQMVNVVIGNDLYATHLHNFEIASDRRRHGREG